MELPLKLLVLGDFSGKESDVELGNRETVSINKDNFNSVMKGKNLQIDMSVDNKISDQAEEIAVNLKIEDLNSFHPEEVAKQVPELRKLLAFRNLLNDLKANVLVDKKLRAILSETIADPAKVEQLMQRLNEIAPSEKGQSEAKTG